MTEYLKPGGWANRHACRHAWKEAAMEGHYKQLQLQARPLRYNIFWVQRNSGESWGKSKPGSQCVVWKSIYEALPWDLSLNISHSWCKESKALHWYTTLTLWFECISIPSRRPYTADLNSFELQSPVCMLDVLTQEKPQLLTHTYSLCWFWPLLK